MAKNNSKTGKGNGESARMTEELELPAGVTAAVTVGVLTLNGPKGEASREIKERNAFVTVEGGKVIISAAKAGKREKKTMGSLRAHVLNMARGVSEGHVYKLKVCFTHFPITVLVSGSQLLVKNFLGEKTPRKMSLSKDVKVKVEGADIVVESVSKEAAGQTAAAIEQITKRANFDTRVFADGIYITVKDGKDFK
ncbi:50S ribosomal protein L6 [Candidatus Woesearchaeota archaeon]|nr:50S ribosomal protein L6 [Candidatus Woesearchaeota archaeon]